MIDRTESRHIEIYTCHSKKQHEFLCGRARIYVHMRSFATGLGSACIVYEYQMLVWDELQKIVPVVAKRLHRLDGARGRRRLQELEEVMNRRLVDQSKP